MEQVIEALKTALPGLLGATSSAVVLSHGALKRRAGVLFMSSVAAYYSYEYLSAVSGMPQGMVSFFIGLLAAPVIETAVSSVPAIFIDWIKKTLGLHGVGK